MAHFAILDENNVVTMVLIGKDDDDERELTERTGQTYKKCSYNTVAGFHRLGGTPFRKNYPSPGYVYDSIRDAFIAPSPYGDWFPKPGEAYPENALYILNEEKCVWEINLEAYPYPNNSPYVDEEQKHSWHWNEDTKEWLTLADYLDKKGIMEKREG